MRNIYVLTSRYMPLISDEDMNNPSFRVLLNERIIHTRPITPELIEETLNKSKPYLLAFTDKNAAMTAMALTLRRNKVADNMIDGDIPFFAVPIVFTVEIDEQLKLVESRKITGEMLYSYMETDTIPNFYVPGEQGFWEKSAIKRIDKKISAVEFCPQGFLIKKQMLGKKLQASYMAANPVREANINLGNATLDLYRVSNQENWMTPPTCCNMF